MRHLALIFVVSCILASSAVAQNNVTTQRVGDYTYFGGSLNGEAVSGTAHQIGSTIYYSLMVGRQPVSFTKQVIGNYGYTQGPDGQTSTSQGIGGYTYTTTPQGITYTTQRVGDFVYTYGSNGCMNTTQTIGAQTYTNGNCPK